MIKAKFRTYKNLSLVKFREMDCTPLVGGFSGKSNDRINAVFCEQPARCQFFNLLRTLIIQRRVNSFFVIQEIRLKHENADAVPVARVRLRKGESTFPLSRL